MEKGCARPRKSTDACRCPKIAAGVLHFNSCEAVKYNNDTQSASSSFNAALTLILAPLLFHIGAIDTKSFPTPTECTRRSFRIKKNDDGREIHCNDYP